MNAREHMSTTALKLTAGSIALGIWSPLVLGAPLLLSQSPPTVPREPAPNIIVSVDNSTSMGSSGVAELRAALKATFSC